MSGTVVLPCQSSWRPPRAADLPRLSGASRLGVDCEVHDPNLMERGPGGVRGDGTLLGVSVAVPDGPAVYIPLCHADDNIDDPEAARRWLRDVLATATPKVGANILYDREWLHVSGIVVRGPTYDVQIAEALLDENRDTYRLDALAQDYLGVGKDERLLREAGALVVGRERKLAGRDDYFDTRLKQGLRELPARYVGPYAEADARLPLEILARQEPRLREQNLWPLFELETELLDLLLAMRLQGVPVDVDRAEQAAKKLETEEQHVLARLTQLVGRTPDIWSGDDLARMCDALGYAYPRTEKGNPSFSAEWLEGQKPEALRLVLRARRLNRAGAVYIRGKILDLQVRGRVYPQFWPVRTEAQGARHGAAPGRFASSSPNLQQVPARDEELAPLVRSIFIPDAGREWVQADWSQQEFRLTVHFAAELKLPGAEGAVRRYRENPKTDFHQLVAELMGVERKLAKTLNLGLSYGMGVKLLAGYLGLPYDEARALWNRYHAAAPFVRALSDLCEMTARRRGYVRTLLGRRQRFDRWGPATYTRENPPLPLAEARARYNGPLQRYFTHKAMNRVIQGSAADMIKVAMRDLWRLGYVPYITVHDELDLGLESDAQVREVTEVMLSAVSLQVPLAVDVERGPSWGEVR